MNLFASVKLAKEALNPEFPTASTNEEKRHFLAQTNCIEVLDPVDLKGKSTYLLETLPKIMPLYWPEGVTLVKTEKQHTMAMQLHLFADSWDHLDIQELKEKQERRRTTSYESSSSHAESQTKL